MILFLKYLWKETIFCLFLPMTIIAPFGIYFLVSAALPMPWILVPLITLIGLGVLFIVEILAVGLSIRMYEIIWTDGFIPWKKQQELGPNPNQEELKKIKQILDRYKLEVQVKSNNPTAAKIYEEYQCILALTDGVETTEDIVLDGTRYKACLISYDKL